LSILNYKRIEPKCIVLWVDKRANPFLAVFAMTSVYTDIFENHEVAKLKSFAGERKKEKMI